MKSKVSLKELVGTKIVYALLLVRYYWMWARRDWHDYYMSIQYAVAGFSSLFFLIQIDRILRICQLLLKIMHLFYHRSSLQRLRKSTASNTYMGECTSVMK